MFNLSPGEPKPKARTISKKRLPFKAPSPLLKRSNQPPLNFFKRSSSSLEPETKKKPLEFKSDSQINKQHAVTTPLIFRKTKSSLSAMTATNTFESIDLTGEEDEEPIVVKNFKNSAPAGSLITKSTRDTTIRTLYTQNATQSTVSSSTEKITTHNSRTATSTFKPAVKSVSLTSVKSSSGQPTFNFTTQKRKNPWDTAPTQAISKKNPRIKPEKPRQTSTFSTIGSLTLSEEQQHVLKLVVEGGKNVFYTGSAGTGKSVLLKEIVSSLKMKYSSKSVAVTASTGLAAVNIGGMTINRFAGMGIGDKPPSSYISLIKRKAEMRENWRRTRVLIIDEISMLDGKFLDKLDQVARGVRSAPDLPFGGIQIVITGDFFQLPPVPDKRAPVQFCFQSTAWRHIHHTILLHKVFRQADQEFVDILNAIRIAEVPNDMAEKLSALKREVHYEDGMGPTELFSTRYEVDNSNRRRLQALPGEAWEFSAIDNYQKGFESKALENTMASKSITLKIGASVMMLKNKDETLVNGSRGVVVGFMSSSVQSTLLENEEGESYLRSDKGVSDVRLIMKCYGKGEVPADVRSSIESLPESRRAAVTKAAGYACMEAKSSCLPWIDFTVPGGTRRELIEREEFIVGDKDRDENPPTRTQIPLLLAWALSIHKSQGQTLDRVKVDLQKVFEAGQVYVSLSRAVSKDRLQILNFDKNKIRCNPDVKKFYMGLETFN